MLAWLPVNAAVTPGSVKVSSIAEHQFQQVSALASVCCTRVLWAHGGRTIGCLLAYRSTPEGVASIRAAVEEVVSLCSWTRKDIEHTDVRRDPSPRFRCGWKRERGTSGRWKPSLASVALGVEPASCDRRLTRMRDT